MNGLLIRETMIVNCLESVLGAIRLGDFVRADISLRFALAELAYLTGPAPR